MLYGQLEMWMRQLSIAEAMRAAKLRLSPWSIEIIFFVIKVSGKDNILNRCDGISFFLEIDNIPECFSIEKLPHAIISRNFWQMRTRGDIFELIVPFQNENFCTLRIIHPGTLIYKDSRVPIKIS